jgi:hypothetical protein
LSTLILGVFVVLRVDARLLPLGANHLVGQGSGEVEARHPELSKKWHDFHDRGIGTEANAESLKSLVKKFFKGMQ